MTDYEKIDEIARKNNNVFKTQMVIEAGIRKEKGAKVRVYDRGGI